ncbi:MAG: ThuA domain-containing protein [Phycisphaerae bacterium]|nr:ThuA domain-containing protein [Phycisphaerae bacterium]
MHKAIITVVAVVLTAGMASDLLAVDKAKAPAAKTQIKPLKVVILVGGHGYDKKNFDKAWGEHKDIQCEVWKDKPYTVFDDISKFDYDVVLLYNLSSGITDVQKANWLKLLKKGVGLVVWHHALADCQNWPEFLKIAGCKFWMKPGKLDGKKVGKSGTGHAIYEMKIANADHPITKGMKDFKIKDESYNKQSFAKGINVLVTTDHPKSDKPIAWTNDYKGAKVFGYQGGHDAKAWTNPGHRRLLGNGMRWVAGRKCINTPMADAAPAGKTFKNLSAAVGFISTCLNKKDHKTLTAACTHAPNVHILKQLAAVHKKQPLPKLYAKQSFPAKGAAFKLGGHDKELGHIHIDFTKQDGAWRLKTIFGCR